MADGQTSASKYILIGCGIALALGVCGVGSCLALVGGAGFFAYEKTEAPAAEGRKFLQALEAGDVPGTLSHVSKGFKARTDPEQVRQSIQSVGEGWPAITDISFIARGLTPDGAHLNGVLTTSQGRVAVELELVEEAGQWRVDQAALGGEPFPLEDPSAAMPALPEPPRAPVAPAAPIAPGTPVAPATPAAPVTPAAPPAPAAPVK
jgi:hypothetical protein